MYRSKRISFSLSAYEKKLKAINVSDDLNSERPCKCFTGMDSWSFKKPSPLPHRGLHPLLPLIPCTYSSGTDSQMVPNIGLHRTCDSVHLQEKVKKEDNLDTDSFVVPISLVLEWLLKRKPYCSFMRPLCVTATERLAVKGLLESLHYCMYQTYMNSRQFIEVLRGLTLLVFLRGPLLNLKSILQSNSSSMHLWAVEGDARKEKRERSFYRKIETKVAYGV